MVQSVLRHTRFAAPLLATALVSCVSSLVAQNGPASLLPEGWDPKKAGDVVMHGLVNTTAPQVKGAHDAGMVLARDRAWIVAEANDVRSGESASWPYVYVTLSVVNLTSLQVEKVTDFARSEQAFENETLPVGACFVPRIIQKDATTLRCYFASEDPGKRQSQMWYTDFDMERMAFTNRIHKVKLKTAAGIHDMQPQYLYQDAVSHGLTHPAKDFGLYIFDSFKPINGKTYVTLNNYAICQNALALVHPSLDTFEVLGHFNQPAELKLSESAAHRLPDGTWLAICRQEGGNRNYTFSTSTDGRTWTRNEERPAFTNGSSSKPTLDKFGDVYFLGWQEATRIGGVSRSVFNLDVSKDGRQWVRKYRFETPKSFQYPVFAEYEGKIYVAVTQGETSDDRKEKIMFGQLE